MKPKYWQEWSKKELDKFTNTSKEELSQLQRFSYERRQERIKEFYEDKKKHEETLQQLKEMLNKTADEVTKNIISFGIEQIEQTILFDFRKCYAEEVDPVEMMNIEEYITFFVSCAQRNIERYTEELREDTNRDNNRYKAYKTFVDEIDKM